MALRNECMGWSDIKHMKLMFPFLPSSLVFSLLSPMFPLQDTIF